MLEKMRGNFRPHAILAGDDYFREQRVLIVRRGENFVEASVQGTHEYDVSIEWEGREWWSDCTCPYAAENDDPCKHIWATLRAAEATGWFNDYDRAQRNRQKDSPQRHAIWRRRITEFRQRSLWGLPSMPAPWPAEKQIIYVLTKGDTADNGVNVLLFSRVPRKSGMGFESSKQLRLSESQIAVLPDPADRQLITMLCGVSTTEYSSYDANVDHELALRPGHAADIVRMMCQTGRCFLRGELGKPDPRPLQWDDGPPWRFCLAVAVEDPGKTYRVEARLQRGEESMPLSRVALSASGGPVIIGDRAAALDDNGTYYLADLFNGEDQLIVPVEQADDLIGELLQFPRLPELTLPPEMNITTVAEPPKPRMRLKPSTGMAAEYLDAEIHFDYGEHSIDQMEETPARFDPKSRTIVHRDVAAEGQAMARLPLLGFRKSMDYRGDSEQYRIPIKKVPAAVRVLTSENWRVEVNGKSYRRPGAISIQVSSGIDWFEVNGEADFEGVNVRLPALLKALRKGENTIVLDDGTLGMLPEEWIKRYRLLAALGEDAGEGMQFGKSQVGLLDALLFEMPQVNVDEAFERARQQMRNFDGVAPADPPASFIGELRPYQRDGLGWMHFLRNFGLNGCLADDMGLGKTVQVLALLEQRRLARKKEEIAPTLVVVPRSLVFNWRQEAGRFAPQLRVLDHAGVDRIRGTDHFTDYDLILTTYGTLRNDIAAMKDMRFDYAILDEAQAIKNPNSESAKAARLIRANHRLVLSGTPVQNHLGDLWSIFEFLNPGMLGASRAFTGASSARNPEPETRRILATALRPFVLRRTKEQVAKDLPEKLEQTIFCELDKTQRKLYDELKEHYRQSLLNRIATEGLAKSKIQILEALLRLRQAACHPALLDKSRIDEASAKLDTLMPRLAEVVDEGHKAIVFSQFTSFLAIVRKRLDESGQPYEYLDGKTRDRQERVERFQNDPECKLFLVSLKAGGLGLNLTAAQYVFLLDPWWNPAIEAQANDRAHRIGQTRRVFAYRLIAKDTVEEKVLQLQQTKRDLADAIINADNAVLANLGKEELELLLS